MSNSPEHLDAQARAKWTAVYAILQARGELDTGTLDAARLAIVRRGHNGLRVRRRLRRWGLSSRARPGSHRKTHS